MIHIKYVSCGEFQWHWKACMLLLASYLSFLCVVLYVEMCKMGMPSGVVVVFCLGSTIGFGGSIMGGGGGSGSEVVVGV